MQVSTKTISAAEIGENRLGRESVNYMYSLIRRKSFIYFYMKATVTTKGLAEHGVTDGKSDVSAKHLRDTS